VVNVLTSPLRREWPCRLETRETESSRKSLSDMSINLDGGWPASEESKTALEKVVRARVSGMGEEKRNV